MGSFIIGDLLDVTVPLLKERELFVMIHVEVSSRSLGLDSQPGEANMLEEQEVYPVEDT